MTRTIENKHQLNRSDFNKLAIAALGTLFIADLALVNYLLNPDTSSPLPTPADVKTEDPYKTLIEYYLQDLPTVTPAELTTQKTIDYFTDEKKREWLSSFPDNDITGRHGEKSMVGENRIPSIKTHITETVRNEMISANNPLFNLTWNIIGAHADLEVVSFSDMFAGNENMQQLIATTVFWNQNSETDYTQKPTILFNADAFGRTPYFNNLGIIKELVGQSSAALVPMWLKYSYNDQFKDPNPPQLFWDKYDLLPYKKAYTAWNLGALGSVFNHPEIISTNKYTIDILSQARINPNNLAAFYDNLASDYAASDIENRKPEDAWMNDDWINYIQDFDRYFFQKNP